MNRDKLYKVKQWIKQHWHPPRDCKKLGKEIWDNEHPSEKRREELEIEKKLTWFEKSVMTLLVLRTWCSLGFFIRTIIFTKEKQKKLDSEIIEVYVIVRILLMILLLCLATVIWRWLGWILTVLLFYILLGSVCQPLRILFVDRYLKTWPKEGLRSFNRTVMLLFVNYLELIVGFAFIYRHFQQIVYSDCENPITTFCEALYFSIVTITTLGYGDMRPLCGWGRFLVSAEVLMGLVLIVFILGLFFIEKGEKQRKTNE